MRIQYKNLFFDLNKPLDISIVLQDNAQQVKAFYAPDVQFEAVKTEDFVGSTTDGGILNFKNMHINPHGNGTHTECLGHITKNPIYINDCLQAFHHLAQLVSLQPHSLPNGDQVITLEQVESLVFQEDVKALILRTLPNESDKNIRDWSNSNPPYIHYQAMQYLVAQGIEHFLIDCPSVDRENDKGLLLAHKAFWQVLDKKTLKESKAVVINNEQQLQRKHCTISEMIFVPNSIKDGLYLLNIQIISVEMDASPSKILLFEPC